MPKPRQSLIDQEIAARSFDHYRHGRDLDDLTPRPSEQLREEKRAAYAFDFTGMETPLCSCCGVRDAYALTDGEPVCDSCDLRLELRGWEREHMDAPPDIPEDIAALFARSQER